VTAPPTRELALERPAVEAGGEVGFRVRTGSDGAFLVVSKRGVPLGSTYVPPVEGEPSTGSIPIPRRARGLAHVVAYRADGYDIGAAPLWVRQETGDAVAVETDQKQYRPGREAELELSYPPTAGGEEPSGEEPPVAFGLFGVDEALYALEERTDLPLPRLLHEPAEAAEAASRAAEMLPSAADADGELRNAELFASARFSHALGDHAMPQTSRHRGRDISGRTAAAAWRATYTVFSTVVGLVALLVLVLAARIPLNRLRAEELEGHVALRCAALTFGALVVFALVGAVLAAVGEGGALFGGAVVWLLTVGGFVVDAIRRHRILKLEIWLVAVGVGLVVALGAAIPWLYHAQAAPSTLVPFQVLGVASTVVVALQIAAWVVVLYNRGHWSGTVGMVTIFWFAVASCASLALANCDQMQNPLEDRDRTRTEQAAAGNQKNEQQPGTAGAGESGGSSDASADGARVREYFPETMVWEPELLSDADGTAELSVELPDSITTWRLTAMAQTRDGRFAQSDHPLVVRKPIFANLELPERVTEGDHVQVPVVFSNESPEPDEGRPQTTAIEFNTEAEGAVQLGAMARGDPGPGMVAVPPGERQVVYVPMIAARPGSGSMTVSVEPTVDSVEGDAVRRSVEVRPDGREKTSSTSGIIRDGWNAELPVPESAIEGAMSVEAAVSGSSVADALEGLDAMLAEPSGCFEQVSSANHPNVVVLRSLRSTEPKEWPGGEEKYREAKERAERLVSLGYQKMLSFRTATGGFRLYPTEELDPDPMLTAYGLMQLADMRDVMEVDVEPVLQETARWLAGRQNQSGTWPVYAGRLAGGAGQGEDVGQVRSTAFVAWAMASVSDPPPGSGAVERALDHVEQAAPDVSDPNALAVAANALLAAGRDEAATSILDRLASSAERGERGAYWSPSRPTWIGGGGRYADIETTALAVHAFARAETEANLVGGALQYLAEARSPRGGWGTTQATVWALRAMERLREASSDGPVDLELYAGGRPMVRAAGDGDRSSLRLEPDDQRLVTFESTPDETGPVSIRVDASDSTDAMVRATARYFVPWSAPAAEAERGPFDLELELDDRRARPQSALEGTVALENRTETAHGPTIVELPIPPGGWAARSQFEELKRGEKVDHFEITPTHVRLYLSGVAPRERLEFPWTFTPTLAGSYALPPVRAYPFYVPRPTSEIDGGRLDIVRPPDIRGR